jgi:hypothetical protein
MSQVGIVWLIVWTGLARLLAAEASSHPPLPTYRGGAPPTELFRRLLDASPAERQKLLAGKPTSSLLIISNALREYEALSPGLREVRLRTLELGWYLEPLLRLPAAERPQRLAAVPEQWRGQIQQRLKLWDSLPDELRQQVLASRSAVRLLLSAPPVPPAAPPLPPIDSGQPGPPPPADSATQSGFPPIPRVSEAHRQRLHTSIRLLFELDPKEQQRILESFSEPQQAYLKKALKAIQTLPAAQRDLCIAGLLKYSSLTPEQQQQFLQNCQRWATLSPQEQAALRSLVALRQRPPPLPPGLPTAPQTSSTGAVPKPAGPTAR